MGNRQGATRRIADAAGRFGAPDGETVLALLLAVVTVLSVASGPVAAGAGTPPINSRAVGADGTAFQRPSTTAPPTASSVASATSLTTNTVSTTGPPKFETIAVELNGTTGKNFNGITGNWSASGNATLTNVSVYHDSNSNLGTFSKEGTPLASGDFTSSTTPDQFNTGQTNVGLSFNKNQTLIIEFETEGPSGRETCQLEVTNPQKMANHVITYNRSTGWDYNGQTSYANGRCLEDQSEKLTTSGGATDFTQGSGPVVVDGNLTVAGTDLYSAANVSIDDGFDPGADVLAADASGVGNITVVGYNATTGVLRLKGTATTSEYQSVLRTVTFNTTASPPATADRNITFTLTSANTSVDTRDGVYYNPATGNYYEYARDRGSRGRRPTQARRPGRTATPAATWRRSPPRPRTTSS